MGRILLLGIVPAYLQLCVILGGASAEGFWFNMALQLLALPIICWSLLIRRGTARPRTAKQLLLITFGAVLAWLIQLVPLPPSIWTELPGRDAVAKGFQLLGVPLPWQPLSLHPTETLASGLWLLPALAVLVGVVNGGLFKAKWIAWSVVIVTSLAVLIATLQVSGKGAWHLYSVTNYGSATGFFANSNHMATLLLVCIPFLAAIYLDAVRAGRLDQRGSALILVITGSLAVILVGIAINGSLAALGLSLPVVFASIMLVIARRRKVSVTALAAFVLLCGGSFFVVLTGPFGNNLVGEQAQSSGSRYESFTTSLEAAKDFMPVGSGFGTFAEIYRSYEDPAAVDRVYMNHVHNDYIELALEGGALGVVLLILFMSWWLSAAIRIWRSQDSDVFPMAATIASGAILAHSFVDYPLRTVAISAILAACCGLMAGSRPRSDAARTRRPSDEVRHLDAD